MPLLQLYELTKSFGGLSALSNLNLTVNEGEIIGLIGPNGAGKTTTFNVIMGTFAPTRGKVIFKDRDITGLKPHFIVKSGLVRSFQRTTLFGDMTVLQNILLAFHMANNLQIWGYLFTTSSTRNKQQIIIDKALELIEFMGLMHLKDQYARNLPHGNQKLLGVAVALATGPDLLLMDEPVTGMNNEETNKMMQKITDRSIGPDYAQDRTDEKTKQQQE